MKRLMMICFVALSTAAHATDSFKAFTSKDGRTLEARIVGNNAAKGKVQIERRNGKKIWVAPDIFSEVDQVYIREWVAADLFLSESKLRISVEKHERNELEEKSAYNAKTITPVAYEIHLDNRTGIKLNHLKIDYRLYVTEKVFRGGSDGARCIAGKVNLKSLPAGAKKSCWTQLEKLITKYRCTPEFESGINVYEATKTKESEDEIRGIWFKMQGPMVGGVPMVREFCLPTDLREKVEWIDASSTITHKREQKLSYDALVERARNYQYGSGGETNYLKAIEFYEQALELDSAESARIERWIANLRLKVCSPSQLVLAEAWAEKNEDVGMYCDLARFYGCSAPADFLNGEKAVMYALKASEKLQNSRMTQEVLAIAYARNGQFDLAVDAQRDVIKSLKRGRYSDSLMDKQKFRYELFKQKKAYTKGMANEPK